MIWRCDLVPQYLAYTKEIGEAITRTLVSGRYVLAEENSRFEKAFADYHACNHCVGVANGTDGLILALEVAGVGPGDEVITTPFTAIPTVSAIIDTGARPRFVDVCPDTFLIDLEKVAEAITPKTKAIMPVHIFGNVVDIPRLREIVGPSMPIIEDACQAHGSSLNGRKAGSMGDMGVFSFYPTKNLGGYGDGGAIITNHEPHAAALRKRRMYGMIDKDHIASHGINSRLDEVQAAILSVKLPYLDRMNEARLRLGARYCRELRADWFEPQRIPPEVVPNYHVFAARFRGDRERLIAYLNERQIQTNIYYVLPLHLQEANRFLGQGRGSLPVCERVCDEVIALPMYPELPDSTLDVIIATINSFPG